MHKPTEMPVHPKTEKTDSAAQIRSESVVIAKRFCGPPQSGNGGYICGLTAEFINKYEGRPVQAKVKAPAPLQTELAILRPNDAVVLALGEKHLVEVQPVSRDLTEGLVNFVGFEDAERYSAGYAGFRRHFFPECFVCGPERAAGDGMHIFCGPAGEDVVAGTWIPDASLGSAEGIVAPRYVWAALDCPGGAAALNARSACLIVLVKLEVELKQPVIVGRKYVVMGWKKKISGKRNLVGSAIFDAGGDLMAVGEGLWLEVADWEKDNQSADWKK